MPPFALHGNTVDPDNAPLSHFPTDAASTNYILLQTSHCPDISETRELSRRGAQILSLEELAEGHCTYLCRYEPADLEALRQLPFVHAAFVYHTDLVIHPLLLAEDSYASGQSAVHHEIIADPAALDATTVSSGNAVEVVITLHYGATETGSWVYEQLQGICNATETLGLRLVASDANTLRAWIPESRLRQLAALDCIASIHPAYDSESRTVAARTLMGLPHLNFVDRVWSQTGYAAQRYQGRGQVVAVSDTGLDLALFKERPSQEDTEDIAEAFKESLVIEWRAKNRYDDRTPTPSDVEQELEAEAKSRTTKLLAKPQQPPGYTNTFLGRQLSTRIVNKHNKELVVIAEGLKPTEAWLVDVKGHGTHVAGCIAGNYTASSGSLTSFQSRKVTGVAPAASLYIQGKENTALARAKRAYDAKARVQNYSWGTPGSNLAPSWQATYAPLGQQVDGVMEVYQTLLVVIAAGNDGDTLMPERPQLAPPAAPLPVWNKQIGSEAAAKNALVVGATWSSQRMAPAAARAHGKPGAPASAEEVAAATTYIYDDGSCIEDTEPKISGHGKFPPNQVAGFSSKGPTLEGFLKPDIVAPGVGIFSMNSRSPAAPRLKPNEPNYSRDPLTWWASGTSMSAPFVSGLAACIHEAATVQYGEALTARTVRAIIVNAAISLEGKSVLYVKKDDEGRSVYDWNDKLGAPPDCAQGFGLVSYPRSIDHLPSGLAVRPTVSTNPPAPVEFRELPSGFCQYENLKVRQSASQTVTIFPGKGAFNRPFTATLVYDDRATAQSGELQADLELKLSAFARQAESSTKLGNPISHRLVRRLNRDGKADDFKVKLSTVRKVYYDALPEPPSGWELAIEISVTAHRTTPPDFRVPFTVAWMTEMQKPEP